MNPTAMSFSPSRLSNADDNNVMLSYKSLVRCLEGESERHELTKKHLGLALTRIKELEEQLKKIEAEKSSLMASGKMMASMLKHNESRLEKLPEAATHAGDKADAVIEGGVKGENEGNLAETVSAQPQTPTKSRATDAEYATNGTTNYEAAEAALNGDDDDATGQTKRFNLDLLNPDKSPDTPASRRSLALRKHFDIDDASNSSVDEAVKDGGSSEKTLPGSIEFRSSTQTAELTPTKVNSKKDDQASRGLTQSIDATANSVPASVKYKAVKLQV